MSFVLRALLALAVIALFVPVSGNLMAEECKSGKCQKQPVASDGFPVIFKKDRKAYAFALREANLLAKARKVWHPLGVAPGCKSAGTGCSVSECRPRHCFFKSGKQLVARARVFAGGRWYWSSQYK